MKLSTFAIVGSTGIAIFSMFFGSGNVVFPLSLGADTGHAVGWALLGLTISAVGAPLLGLLSAVLFEGDCKQFFYRIGTVPGYLVVLLILALLGPLGVMPRCFTVAYAAIQTYFPHLSLLMFSIICGIATLLLLWRRDYILPLLGLWLSPILILTLLAIIVVGVYLGQPLQMTHYTPLEATLEGLLVGYNTMDLLASIVFSVSIWILLKEELALFGDEKAKKRLIPTYVGASLIGGGLLGLIYVGLSYIAAAHSQALQDVDQVRILAQLAVHLLGSKLGLVANIAILLACITTVMSLAVAVVDVIHLEIMNTSIGQKIPYSYGVMTTITLILTVIFSNLGFSKIMGFLGPILESCYPAVIVLTICNILYKLYGFKIVKVPFYVTLLMTIVIKSAYAQGPELFDITIENTSDKPQLMVPATVLQPGKDYLFMIQNPSMQSYSFHYEKLGQHVFTRYMQGSPSVSQDSIHVPPQSKVLWHFTANIPGEFALSVTQSSNLSKSETVSLKIESLKRPTFTGEKVAINEKSPQKKTYTKKFRDKKV